MLIDFKFNIIENVEFQNDKFILVQDVDLIIVISVEKYDLFKTIKVNANKSLWNII
jgi:hypothetical protein